MAAELDTSEEVNEFNRHALAWINHMVTQSVITDDNLDSGITNPGTVAKLVSLINTNISGKPDEVNDLARQAIKAINFAKNAGGFVDQDVEDARAAAGGSRLSTLRTGLTEDMDPTVVATHKLSFAF